ncbi:hypothetical protein ACJRO7_030854 [Eucalyptus globulus]|uniref:Uncharacterized protein n=1 Tax=Eucalyptus globulus TaxID=34317 RepID=A0ABD3JCX7_EUCGL
MMMNTSRIDCMEIQNPAMTSKTSVEHYQWAESALFLRSISTSTRGKSVIGDDPIVDRNASRQRFLRSYRFSRKEETLAQRTKKWWRTTTGPPSTTSGWRTRARRRGRAMATVLNRLSRLSSTSCFSVRGSKVDV